MDPIEKLERKLAAERRLRAQRERTGRLRSRAVAISLIVFVLLWGVVFVQLATGNDPVLAQQPSPKTASRPTPKASETSAPGEVGGEVAGPEPLAGEEPIEPEPEPAPVTTSQS